MCICVCVCLYEYVSYVYNYPKKPEVGVGCFRTGVTGDCELPDMGALEIG